MGGGGGRVSERELDSDCTLLNKGNWTVIVPYLTKASVCSVGCDGKHVNNRHEF